MLQMQILPMNNLHLTKAFIWELLEYIMPKAGAEKRQAKTAAKENAREYVVQALENKNFEWKRNCR
jgi:hypothetical protein